MTARTNNTIGRYSDLDALRIVAALMVCFYHFCALGPSSGRLALAFPALEPWAKYGYLGVDAFFIISGFVIAVSAEGRTALTFARARAKRLYPAFLVACALTTAIIFILPDKTGAPSLYQILANLTLFAPYFGQESIDGVYWSLYVEIRFYILIAAILLIGKFNHIMPLIALWLALSLINLFWPIPFGSGGLLLAYAPLFSAGVIYSVIARRQFVPWHVPILIASLALSIGYGLRRAQEIDAANSFSLSLAAVSLVLLTAHGLILLIALVGAQRRLTTLPFLGALSYPLYLVHNEIGTRLITSMASHMSDYAALATAIGASLALATGINLFVERRLHSRRAAFSAG
jgi:peptidoglycan/LPS O-acetylase OafA/YrhL